MSEYRKFYDQLNGQQKLAVSSIDGPVLVLAGPGTGKTQLLSVRAGHILEKSGCGPENILILTYTNSAARAMKERLAAVIGGPGYEIEAGTFHSFANSIIQESEDAANYVGDRVLMSEVECAKVIEYILNTARGIDQIRPFRAPYTYMRDIIQRISELKKDGITPDVLDDYLSKNRHGAGFLDEKYIKRLDAFAVVYRMYEKLKSGSEPAIFDERGRYDFDDMIIIAKEALFKEKTLRDEFRKRYTYVMVDEFQDTNLAQLELLFKLLDYKSPNLACVGDDDQSIYRFQGASVGNFKLLSKTFPDLKTVSLKDNYRSSKELIDISSRLISLIPHEERVVEKELSCVKNYASREVLFKEFTTGEEELDYIVKKVEELKDSLAGDKSLTEDERRYPYNNIAVLVRKRDDILRVIDAFLRAGIPYATDGKEDISGEKRVRQLLDALELAHVDPNDHAAKDTLLYRVISADYFRIPHSDILKFMAMVNEEKRTGDGSATLLGEFLKCFLKPMVSGSGFARPDRLTKAAAVIDNLLTDAATRSVHTILLDFIKDSGMYRFVLEEYSENGMLRIRQLRALGSFVNMVKASDLARPAVRLDEFMDEMRTRKEHGIAIQGSLVTMSQSGVRVYTAHGSKGLEFHSVIIPFCLQNKNWPIRPMADKIKLPSGLFRTKESVRGEGEARRLFLQDETRLFYVAMTRAKANLIFTSSPGDDSVSSFYFKELDIESERPDVMPEEEAIEKSVKMTDRSDPFIGTEEVLGDMVRNMSLNPTRLNRYITCRRSFLYNDVLKLPGAKKKSLVFGNCVHKALEETYKRLKKAGKFPSFAFFRDAFEKELKFQGVDKVMAHDCLSKLETLKEWFDNAAKSPIPPIGLEAKLMITIGDNIIFTGKYDKVEWDDEKRGLVRILDYKTGKPDEHLKEIDACRDISDRGCDAYLRQLVAYKMLFERDRKESLGRKVSKASLVFIEPVSAAIARQGYKKGQFVTKDVVISDCMVLELEGLIKNVWSEIKALRFEKLPERDKDICRTCDFDSLCWGER